MALNSNGPSYDYGSNQYPVPNRNEETLMRQYLLVSYLDETTGNVGGFEDITQTVPIQSIHISTSALDSSDPLPSNPNSPIAFDLKQNRRLDTTCGYLFWIHLAFFTTISLYSILSIYPSLYFSFFSSRSPLSYVTESKSFFSLIFAAFSSFLKSTFFEILVLVSLSGMISILGVIIWFKLMRHYALWTVFGSLIIFVLFCLRYAVLASMKFGLLSLAGGVPLLFAGLSILFYLSILKHIYFAQAILSGAVSALVHRKHAITVSFISTLFQALWIIFWTFGSFSILVKFGLLQLNGINSGDIIYLSPRSNSTFNLGGAGGVVLLMNLLLSFFWPILVLRFIAYTTVAGSVADWWLRHDHSVRLPSTRSRPTPTSMGQLLSPISTNSVNSMQPLLAQQRSSINSTNLANTTSITQTEGDIVRRDSQTWHALRRAISSSFGAICFAALIAALVQCISSLTRIFCREKKNEDQVTVNCFCIINLFLHIIERLTRYFNEYALVFIAIFGDSFIQASKSTYEILVERNFIAVINDDVSSYPIILGQLLIIAATTYFGYIYSQLITSNQPFWLFPVISGSIGAVIGGGILSIIPASIKSTLVIWASQPERMAVVRREHFYNMKVHFDDLNPSPVQAAYAW